MAFTDPTRPLAMSFAARHRTDTKGTVGSPTEGSHIFVGAGTHQNPADPEIVSASHINREGRTVHEMVLRSDILLGAEPLDAVKHTDRVTAPELAVGGDPQRMRTFSASRTEAPLARTKRGF